MTWYTEIKCVCDFCHERAFSTWVEVISLVGHGAEQALIELPEGWIRLERYSAFYDLEVVYEERLRGTKLCCPYCISSLRFRNK